MARSCIHFTSGSIITVPHSVEEIRDWLDAAGNITLVCEEHGSIDIHGDQVTGITPAATTPRPNPPAAPRMRSRRGGGVPLHHLYRGDAVDYSLYGTSPETSDRH